MILPALVLSIVPLMADDPAPARDVLPRLAELMREGIDRKKPNASFARELGVESIFDGSFDWHSCVVAHWALLTIARVEDDEELGRDMLARLGPDVLAAELEILARETPHGGERITSPYDRAWFVMLLAELERHAVEDAASLRKLRLAAEKELIDYLEASSFPERLPPLESGGKRFCGFYRSWLFAFWLLQMSEPVTPGAAETLEHLRRERIEPERAALVAHDDPHPFDFLWVPAILALIDRTADRASPYVPPTALEPLPETVKISTVHVLGVRLSRLWPCALDAHGGDEAARAVFEAHTRKLLGRKDLWEGDFAACSHWVPQYLFIGLWLADGRP
ncbi:MAG: DUF2891 family protein [bacterium]|nr:DUF2891 family protein [bacterium]